MTIGQRIAQKRKELGLSQEALGSKLGVSRQSIYKWEADSALPEVDKLIALSRLFGVSVGWLLGVEEPPEADAAPAETGGRADRGPAEDGGGDRRPLHCRPAVAPEAPPLALGVGGSGAVPGAVPPLRPSGAEWNGQYVNLQNSLYPGGVQCVRPDRSLSNPGWRRS